MEIQLHGCSYQNHIEVTMSDCDCTTCRYAQSCDTEILCEERSEVFKSPRRCPLYEERKDGLVLTQVWDWR